MREFAKDLIASVDLFSAERLQPLRAEAFDGERAHDSAVEHSALEYLAIHFLLRRDVSHEASGKGIACAGRITHFFHRQCWSTEWMIAAAELAIFEEHRCSILAVLDH